MIDRKHEAVALIDMDGTLADFDGQMQRDLESMRGPGESQTIIGFHGDPPHIEARKNAIKRQPHWWRKLPKLEKGFNIVTMLRTHGFKLMILTKGPYNTTASWTEKVDWCREHIPDAQITVTEDKGLVYGKLLVDDWPLYIKRWLEWRPRGLVIMPDQPWNQNFEHPNVFRYRGDADDVELKMRLQKIVG
jgi:5'(3')-deoxyribonucleotidase